MKPADPEITKRLFCAQFEDGLRQEFNQSVKDRVERYYSVKQWKLPLTPYTHFAPISAECLLLYRDGYFFACIALCQSVAEALSRFLCEKFLGRAADKHVVRVRALRRNLKITAESEFSFDKIHERRNDYHHLNPGVPIQKEELQEIAYLALKALEEVEKEVFAFGVENGILIPKYPQLWPKVVVDALRRANQ